MSICWVEMSEPQESRMSDGGSEARRRFDKGDGDCMSISWVAGITCVSPISEETICLN